MKTSKVLLVVIGLLVLSMLAACAAPRRRHAAARRAATRRGCQARWHRILRAQLYRQRPGVVLSAARRRK